MPSHVLVISGLPGSGKSTIARRLQASLSWPLLAKDDFKERLFDTIGSTDASTSRSLSLASYALMFDIARQLAGARVPFILEGNFRWQETAREFGALYDHARFTQVWCTAPQEVIVERLRQRARSASRHPGHRDAENLPTLIAEVSRASAALPLSGEVIAFDSVRDDAARIEKLARMLVSRP